MKRNQTGFTLVEIAIVLVIIGLLLGGILKGQEMITQAKIKNAITDYSGISAAYFGYQDRYRATPGDDAQATRWTTPTAAVPGDGNRVLSGAYNPSPACPTTPVAGTTPESCLWWDHLRRSGFVSGSGAMNPNNAFNGVLGAQTGDGATPPAAVLGGITNLILCSSNLPDKVAIALDVQMDDGLVATGAVRGIEGNAAPTNTPATAFVEDGVKVYTLCRQF